MTRRESLLGWSYLLISIFVLPVVLVFLNAILGKPMSDTVLNLALLWVNFGAVTVIFHRFLISSLKLATDHFWRCLRFAFFGFGLYYLVSIVIAQIIGVFFPDFSNVNDEAVMGLFQEHPDMMAFTTVFLVPITEETLYRGLFFQGFQRKNRVFAYCLSTVVFAGIHIISYIGRTDFLTLLICFIQYLPAGICFAWVYVKADSVWAPILMHMANNHIAMFVTR